MAENNTEQIIKHLDSIIAMEDSIRVDEPDAIVEALAFGLIARARNAVEKIAGKGSIYYEHIESVMNFGANDTYKAIYIIGVLKGLRGEIVDGNLSSMTELIHARVFNNFLDMAEHLLVEGYKDAAAVIGGSALEAHLRQLSIKSGISLEISKPDGKTRPKSASQLNQELGKSAYKPFDQKMVTAWLDIRNNAAHGKYSEYSRSQVETMIEGIRDFIERNPA